MKELFESSYLSVMSEENDKLRKEIERLKEENKKYNKWIESLNKENHKLQSIIKEVREYINDNVAVYAFNNKKIPHWEFNDDNINDILERLNKED